MTHSCIIHACVAWLIHSWQDLVILVTRLIHTCVKTIHIRDKMIHIFDKTIHIRDKASDKANWYLWQHALLCDTTGKQLITRWQALFAVFGDGRPFWLIFVTRCTHMWHNSFISDMSACCCHFGRNGNSLFESKRNSYVISRTNTTHCVDTVF